MKVKHLLDIIGIGKPVKDLLIAIDEMPQADGGCLAKGLSSQGGGKVASAMVAAARQGMKCGMYAVLGDDAKGRFCKADFERHGIDVTHLSLLPGKTSPFCLCIAEKSTQTRRLIGDIGSAPMLDPAALDFDYLRAARLIHLENGDPASRAAAEFARANGILTSIDADSYSPRIAEMEPLIDLFIASAFYAQGRFPGLSPETAARRLHENGCRVAIITLGAKGLVGCTDSGPFSLPAFSGLEVIDTTGAGDVFHGGFISAWLRGLDAVESARWASAVSYIKCTRLGGRAGIPTREMVDHFLREGTLIHGDELDARSAFYRDLVN